MTETAIWTDRLRSPHRAIVPDPGLGLFLAQRQATCLGHRWHRNARPTGGLLNVIAGATLFALEQASYDGLFAIGIGWGFGRLHFHFRHGILFDCGLRFWP